MPNYRPANRVHLALFFLFAVVAQVTVAQVPDTAHPVPGATVSGVVRDSIAHAPLAGATVQLVGADSGTRFGRTVASDALGRYTLTNLPDGRYTIGFFHPMLDSLGVEPPLRPVNIEGHQPVHLDLASPSVGQVRSAVCGGPSSADSGAVVIGIVRDARDRAPAAGVAVTGEWLELSFTTQGLVRRMPHLVATTGENGWFALCNVPAAGTMALTAARGEDSTDRIELQIPAEGFLRRELYIGPSRTVITAEEAQRGDTAVRPPRRVRVGDGHLNGVVVRIADGRPLAGARVGIVNGPQTTANERGEWTLAGAPAGTRMLDVRGVGYYPESRPVDVVAGAAPVRSALFTFSAMLDTVKVTANRLRFDSDRSGFEARRRSGVGHYLTPADIARRGAIVTSDIFRSMPGVRLDIGPDGFKKQITINSPFGYCQPSIYLDGFRFDNISAGDIDDWASPGRLSGVEVYSEASVPPQYQQGMTGCGTILLWTR
jgi:hypothetical protein